MFRVITVLVMLVLSFFFTKLEAQNTTSPCSSPEYQQFDFWVGNWNVYNTKNQLIGENNIVTMPNACTIQENWKSQNGKSLGTSYSYYDISDKQWHQLWIDNKGFVLETSGSFKDNKMILKSNLIESPKGKYYNQITWVKNSDGTVTQIWDYVSPEGKIIQQAFKGIYKKKNG
ncbi:hypothetical protein EV195_11514 [Tenacibaculum skagerrakense]|uniref:Lipocalin-like protein n=1 Tax=Tenacibaculum skagerrakense TaxID=186571 RepID=A0A4R2NKB9_9FLAO|nr:hypothetical protein [Tenacibaculum skagerrakense]TCP21901.1 hypothetical protein EV195_11514 [Tenacibaculum skagerrakense]